MLVIMTAIVCSACGAPICAVGCHSTPVQTFMNILMDDHGAFDGGITPEDGIPGGPPGTPG